MAKKNDTKSRITEVAWKLFNEKGYNSTTVDDIILASGTSKGSFYHYFNSKDELLSTLSDLLDNMYREIEDKIDGKMNSFDRLIVLSCLVHERIENEIPLELLSSLYSSQVVTKGYKHLLEKDRYYYTIVRKFVEEGQERGEITKEIPASKICEIYIMSERAIVYDYCICDGKNSLLKTTEEFMPLLFSSAKA